MNERPETRRPSTGPWTPTDILAGPADPRRRHRSRPVREVPLVPGLVVEHRDSGFCGAVVRLEWGAVVLSGRGDVERAFRLEPGGFLVDGDPVTLVVPARSAAAGPHRVGLGRRAPGPGPGGPAQPHLGRGRARRRARRAGVGRRPAHRGRGGRAPRRHRRPGRRGADVRARAGPARSACWSTTWSPGRRRPASPPSVHHAARARDRHAVRRRVAGGAARRLGHRRVAGDPRGRPWKEGVCAALGVARSGRRCGGGSSPRCAPTPTSSPPLVGAVERLIDFVATPSN